MLIEYLLSLKRKFLDMAGEYDDEKDESGPDIHSPRKKLRVEGSASSQEAHTTTTPLLAACDAGHGDEETVEELEAKVKELEETIVRGEKEAEKVASKLKKVEAEDMECRVCHDTIHNPQVLRCGHSACYGCLRDWWTQPPAEYDGAEMIDTEAEAEVDEVEDQANPEAADGAPLQQPRPRPRHQFPSAVNRQKLCPCCNEVVTRRPIPDFQLRDVVETLRKDLAVPPQASPKARLTRRPDLWHGIFYPEDEWSRPIAVPRLDPELGPPPHPDPILNHFAQAQYRRAVEEAAAQRERLRAEAYEDGRTIGRLLIQAQWDRAEAQRAAEDRQREQRPPVPADPRPVVPQAPGGAGVVPLLQDPAPEPPAAVLQPPLDEPAVM